MLNGIDISHWQQGLDLDAVPCDFVILKATEGTTFVDKTCDKFYQKAKKNGKLLGVYHYADGGDVYKEADFFINNCKNYIGEAILVLDWESQGNASFGKNDFNWVKTWLDYVYSKTGVKPMLYISKSIMPKFKGIGNYGLWIAQYANDKPTGYQDKPWNEGAYTCAMRQYTSNGRLNDYNGRLDLDKFYGDATAWTKYASSKGQTKPVKPVTPAPAKKSYDEIAKEVVAGKWGNGDDRKKRLESAGYNYSEVQKKVNALLGTVKKTTKTVYHTVKYGETLSAIASKYGTNYKQLAKINGLANPNLIYPGQKIKIK